MTVTILGALAPWLFLKAQQFRLYNTSHRGLRFGFPARLRDAYRMALPHVLLWMRIHRFDGGCFNRRRRRATPRQRWRSSPCSSPCSCLRCTTGSKLSSTGTRRRGAAGVSASIPREERSTRHDVKGLGVGIMSMVLPGSTGGALAFALSRWHANPVVAGVRVRPARHGTVYMFIWPYISGAPARQVVWRHTYADDVRFDTTIGVWPLMRLVGSASR